MTCVDELCKYFMVKKRKENKPQLGDWIGHSEPAFDRYNEGRVVELLAAQFVYETSKGDRRFCLYKEMWKLANASDR